MKVIKYLLFSLMLIPVLVKAEMLDSCGIIIYKDSNLRQTRQVVQGDRYNSILCYINGNDAAVTMISSDLHGMHFNSFDLDGHSSLPDGYNNRLNSDDWLRYICNPTNKVDTFGSGDQSFLLINNTYAITFEPPPFDDWSNIINDLKKVSASTYMGKASYWSRYAWFGLNDDGTHAFDSPRPEGQLHLDTNPRKSGGCSGIYIDNIYDVSSYINELESHIFGHGLSRYLDEWIKGHTIINGKKVPNKKRFEEWVYKYFVFYSPAKGKGYYPFSTEFLDYVAMDKYKIPKDSPFFIRK